MRERKYVKFRVDMYEDTKFKIIDMKAERDVIHYIWNRIVMLAGKVNMEGSLFFSKSLPYTIETLAIEFNRDSDQVKLALETFIELEMVEFIEDKIYRVKNFAKHQNIKVKENETIKAQNIDAKNSDDLSSENLETSIDIDKYRSKENKKIDSSLESTVENDRSDLEATSNEYIDIDEKISDKTSEDISKKDCPIMLVSKKSTEKRKGRKKKSLSYDSRDIVCEDITDTYIDGDMCGIIDGNIPLRPSVTVTEWSFA